MTWSEKDLEKLPRKQGFRLRGLEMTRLETFIDAAFAFAITILVISINDLPKNYQELVRALKDIPAFAGSFAIIMSVWVSHRKWSRRYGLEDMISILISLVLMFIMLVYVYPLKLLFSVLFAWISGGWLPSQLSLNSMGELIGLFVIYGLGGAALGGMMALLFARAKKARASLGLNELECTLTVSEIASWTIFSITALISAVFAGIMPAKIGKFAGFTYFLLPITMPIVATHYYKKAEKIDKAALNEK